MTTPSPEPHASLDARTPLGPMRIVASPRGVRSCEFLDSPAPPPHTHADSTQARDAQSHAQSLARELDLYFAGRLRRFETPLDPGGTPFQVRVWHALIAIPFGRTVSYAALARSIGRPGAQRAVGAANAANRLPIVVPCHRVIAADGGLHGYGGGLARKQALLALESADALLTS